MLRIASPCATAGLASSDVASASATALQANGIGDRLEEVEDMPRDAREGVLVRERHEGGLARGEQLARRGPLHGVPEGHATRGELADPATDPDQVVVARGRPVPHADLGDGEVYTLLLE